MYNNVAKATELIPGSNYHLFKLGIKPMWEDAANEKGGKWVMQIPKARKADEVNDMWMYTVSLIFVRVYFLEVVAGVHWRIV